MSARFEFHDFGERAEERFVACDGLVEGAGVHLSHWAGNRTPPELKRDTSTEIALVFAESEREALAECWVANNHFDSDGVLSVWALVEPDCAMERRDRIVAAAEAGDFDEWPDDDGVRLDAAIRALARGAASDAEAYDGVLPQLAALIDGLSAREDLERDGGRQGLEEPEAWAVKGSLGMTGLLRTDRPVVHRPERVAEALLVVDRD